MKRKLHYHILLLLFTWYFTARIEHVVCLVVLMYIYDLLKSACRVSLCAAEMPVAAKLLAYNRANRAVAILCNHQRAVSKNFGKQMENLQAKVSVFFWLTSFIVYVLRLLLYHRPVLILHYLICLIVAIASTFVTWSTLNMVTWSTLNMKKIWSVGWLIACLIDCITPSVGDKLFYNPFILGNDALFQ